MPVQDDNTAAGGLAGTFERVVCISLRRREDRRRRLRALADRTGWPFREIEFMDAVDGGSGCVPVPPGFISGGGAWGCRQSWVRVLEQAMADGVRSILVLEDDAIWRDDVGEHCQAFFENVPANWEAVFLGGQNMATPPRIAPGVCRTVNTQRTHAIGLRGNGIRNAYAVIASSDRHIDHKLGPSAGTWRTSYQPEQFIFGQDATKSDISGRQDYARFWTHPAANYPVLWLNATADVANRLTEYGIHYGFDLDETGCDRGLANCFPRPGEYRGGLGGFLRSVSWEAASFLDDTGVTTVWHPHADDVAYDQAKRELPARVVVTPFFAEFDDAQKWLAAAFGDRIIRRRQDRRRLPVLLLKSPGPIVEELRGRGLVHTGRWRESVTGIDMGLMTEFRKTQEVDLAKWFSVLEQEARETNVPVGIYHPLATVEVAATCGRDVVQVDATNADEAAAQIEEALL